MIIAVCNQKGGVGKTTIATHLAHRLARRGTVLLVDTDPQGNATTTLGVTLDEDSRTLNDVLAAVAAGQSPYVIYEAIVAASTPWGDVDVVPADRLLASRAEDNSLGRESRLRTALTCLGDDYTHVVIDCPPGLGMLTTNALVAADQALVVTTPRETAIDGVAEMITTVATVRNYYNSKLSLCGVLVNAYRSDRVDRRERLAKLREYYANYIFDTCVPERELIPQSSSQHQPVPVDAEPALDHALAAIAHKIEGRAS